MRSIYVALVVFCFAVTDAIAADISIASFNIQIFGKTKMSKPAIRSYLATIIRKYDIVAVQEIKDISGEAPDTFLEEINKTERKYAYVISERTGKQDDDRNSQEQYAYYFDTNRIVSLDQGAVFNDSGSDLFQREPYTARFRVKGVPFTFTITSIHTRPESAVDEIKALFPVYQDVKARYPTEAHHLIVGDFNASCSYASPGQLDVLKIRGPEFHWIVPDSADTNVSTSKACAYDRLVANKALFSHFKAWGISSWFTDKKYSDHWPVWVTFKAEHP